MYAELIFESGLRMKGEHFGARKSVSGELVFNTGMTGYPETMTDPSYAGQLLVFTYPMIGNYGIPGTEKEERLLRHFESDTIHPRAIIVTHVEKHFSHWKAQKSIEEWMREHDVVGLHSVDTRAITKYLSHSGNQLAKIQYNNQDVPFENPNIQNLVAQVSITEPIYYAAGKKRIVLIDTGCKFNIIRSFLQRGVSVLRVPWDYDYSNDTFDGIMLTNGPGDPSKISKTVDILRPFLQKNKPIFGICLGHQILSRAAGASTYKMSFGHRSQNQPCIFIGSKRCLITSQNHGYAVDVDTLPEDWKPWFFNANDGSNEGIAHKTKNIRSVQFHPEATPGPTDAAFLFDDFVKSL